MATRSQIPPTGDVFVGRAEELARIEAWLGQDRLVSIVGPPGAGKTRLSREFARLPRDEFAAVRFADLSDARTVADVIDRLAELWDVNVAGQSTQERAHALAEAAKGRPTELVILDNFESVLDATDVVVEWARTLEHRFLITTTTTLDVRGEHVVRLGALSTDEGAELFMARAFSERGRTATDGDLACTERIVDRLDGLPLAIELAARQTTLFSTAELESQLDSALELLASGPRDAPARHQSLRAMVRWGWSHLDAEEQTLMRAAAVFEGGVPRDALAAVVDRPPQSIIGLLAQLQRKSMLVVEQGDARPRLLVLNTITAFIREQLGDDTDEWRTLAARHLRWFAAAARRWLDDLNDATHARQFERDRANIVAALRRAPRLSFDTPLYEDAVVLGLALRELHERRGVVPQTAELIGHVLAAAPSGFSPTRSSVMLHAEYGELLRRAGDPRGPDEVANAVVAATALDDPHALCRALLIQAEILFTHGDRSAGLERYREAVDVAARSQDARLELDARQSHVVAKHFVGEFVLAEHEAVHALAARVGDPWIEATCLTNIGIYLRGEGRVPEAIPRFNAAIERFRELGDEATAGHVMLFLGVAHLYGEQFDDAEAVLREAQSILQHRGPEVRQMAEVALARVAVARGELEDGDRLLADLARRADRDEAFETAALAIIERYFVACLSRQIPRVRAVLRELPDPQRVRSFDVHTHTRVLAAVASALDGDPTALDDLIEELHEEPVLRAFAVLQRAVLAALRHDDQAVLADLLSLKEGDFDPMARFEVRRWWRWLGGEDVSSGPRLLVERDCMRVRPPDGDWIDLSRKGRSRAVVRTLVEHRVAVPGVAMAPETLFENAWPDTSIQHDSAMARVYTAISEIRKMGLADMIERTDLGYLIPAEVVIEEV